MAALISSIRPDCCQCDDPGTLVVNVFGSGFDGTTKINWDGADIGTTLVSPTQLQTSLGLNPSGASGPKYVPVKVTGDPTVLRFNWQPNAIPGSTKAWYPAHP